MRLGNLIVGMVGIAGMVLFWLACGPADPVGVKAALIAVGIWSGVAGGRSLARGVFGDDREQAEG